MNSNEKFAAKIANRYIKFHKVTDGWDYSILGEDFTEIDGGVYDDPEMDYAAFKEMFLLDVRAGAYASDATGSITFMSKVEPLDFDELEKKHEVAEAKKLETRKMDSF